MSVGYADDEDLLKPEEIDPGGLDQFDEEQAIANLANVGQAPAGMPDATPAPDIAAPDIQAQKPPALPDIAPASQQGGSEPGGPHTPDSAGSTPAPATTELQPGQGGVDVTVFPPVKPPGQEGFALPQFDELGPLPPRPAPTGDPAKDIAAITAWTQQLDARHAELERRKGALANFAAQVGGQKGRKEAEVAQTEAKARRDENARFLAEQERRQGVIDDAVAARMSAYKDLEGAKWDKPHTGGEIFALIVGGIGAAMQNAGAAQIGQVGHAENEAAKSIAGKMQREYDAKKLKVQAAGDAVLAAQYGYKTAGENHRAAMNALDAEMAAKYKLVAKEAQDQLQQSGAPEAAINSDLIITENLQKAAAHEQQVHDREQQRATGANHAKALEDIARATLGQRSSEHIESMDERQREFNLRAAEAAAARRDREAAAAEKAAAAKEKADTKQAAEDEKAAVYTTDPKGNRVFRGLAATPRNVLQIGTRATQYDDAIDSVKTLLARKKTDPIMSSFPMGSDYDRAVLAVAATTTANASDKTTTHEQNTIKDYGLVSEKGLRNTLHHLEKRRDAFMAQLHQPGEKVPAAAAAPEREGGPPKKIGGTDGLPSYELGADGNYHKVK